MDIGLERLRNSICDMAKHSEDTVFTAIDAYSQGKDLTDTIFKRSEELRIMLDEVDELAVEIISRYQPVASDVRFLKSCMEIAYGFSRFGRYAYDITEVLRIFGDLSMCDKKAIEEAGNQAKDMIKLSIKAFMDNDVATARKLREMDDVVDRIYVDSVKNVAQKSDASVKCSVSAVLILRYLERIADHATYIGNSVMYIVSGERPSR